MSNNRLRKLALLIDHVKTKCHDYYQPVYG